MSWNLSQSQNIILKHIHLDGYYSFTHGDTSSHVTSEDLHFTEKMTFHPKWMVQFYKCVLCKIQAWIKFQPSHRVCMWVEYLPYLGILFWWLENISQLSLSNNWFSHLSCVYLLLNWAKTINIHVVLLDFGRLYWKTLLFNG